MRTVSLVARAAACAAVGVSVCLLLAVAFGRLFHPAELEWMEGAMLDETLRVLDRQPLYAPPTTSYVPWPYGPLFFGLAASLCWLLGEGLAALRLCALVPTLVSLVLIAVIVRRDTGRRVPAWLAAGLYAASYPAAETYHDLGRVDALAFALALAMLATLRQGMSLRRAVAAGWLGALAIVTKQPMAAVVLSTLLAVTVGQPRAGLAALATSVGLAGLVFGAHEVASDGWCSFWLLDVPGSHPWIQYAWLGFWRDDLLAVPLLLGVPIVAGLGARRSWSRAGLPVVAFVAGCLVAAWSSRLHQGGWKNVLLPAFGSLALAAGYLLARLEAWVGGRRWPVAVAHGLVALQAAWLWFDPSRWLPAEGSAAAQARLVGELAKLEPPILMPEHGALARQAGHRPTAHAAAMADLFLAGERRLRDPSLPVASRAERVGELFWLSLRRQIAERRFGAIVVDSPGGLLPWLGILDHYHLAAVLLEGLPPEVLRPVAGSADLRQRPLLVLRPKM